MGDIHPDFHHCDLRELNYKMVNDGTIFCTVCGRIWDLTPKGWWPDPVPAWLLNRNQKQNQYRPKGNKRAR